MCGACTTATDEQTDDVPAAMHDPRVTARSFALEGVTCGGCASRVAAAANEVPGVRAAEVDLATDTLSVTTAELEIETVAEQVRTAVRTAGYGIR